MRLAIVAPMRGTSVPSLRRGPSHGDVVQRSSRRWTATGSGHQLASLPMRMGGLGLRSAVRTSPAAFWASWADALSMIQTRLPVVDAAMRQMGAREVTGCLAELQESTRVLGTTTMG